MNTYADYKAQRRIYTYRQSAISNVRRNPILSDSDRIEINFNFKTAHVWKIVNYPVAILARTLPSLSHTFH